eukprot:6726875-Lingulodinium_polyedra.AAC.1
MQTRDAPLSLEGSRGTRTGPRGSGLRGQYLRRSGWGQRVGARGESLGVFCLQRRGQFKIQDAGSGRRSAR